MGYVGDSSRNLYPDDFEIPVAVRQIEFCNDDCLETHFNEVESVLSDEETEGIVSETFEIQDTMEGSVIRVTSEYPIVRYYRQESQNYLGMGLNGFVDEVIVSVIGGYEFNCNERFEPVKEIIGDQVIAYRIDPFNVRKAIINYDINNFLKKKPQIVVSISGAILFYNEEEIMATLNCDTPNIVSIEDILEAAHFVKPKLSEEFKITEITKNVITISYIQKIELESGNYKEEEQKVDIKYKVLVDALEMHATPILKVIQKL